MKIIDISKFSMGMTAAITTSLGLIAGLTQGNGEKTAIITGLLIVAIADNISDSLGIHIYKESEGALRKETDSATYGNFLVRLLLVSIFILIVLLFSPYMAFLISSLWGLFLLAVLSYSIAKSKKTNPLSEIVLHLTAAVLVIVGSKLLGALILNKIK
jgi:vacuolar iron transporter family protein